MKARVRNLNKRKNDKILFLLSVIAGLACLSLWLYVTLFIDIEERAFGEKWVCDEIVFLSISKDVLATEFDLVFEFKPISLFIIFGISYWITGLEYLRRFFIRLSTLTKRILFLFSVTCTMVSTYEAAFSFVLWNSKITSLAIQNPNLTGIAIDKLAYFNPIFPVNLNFSTKIYSLTLFASVYGVYYFHSLIYEKVRKSKK